LDLNFLQHVDKSEYYKVRHIGKLKLVPKSNGYARWCFNGSKLDPFHVSPDYSQPCLYQPLATNRSYGACTFIKDYYLHFEVTEEFSFWQVIAHNGELYRFTRMIFGTKSASYVAQRFSEFMCEVATLDSAEGTLMAYYENICITAGSFDKCTRAMRYIDLVLE
jgi:hypothetical protein